ncbi:peptidoglycan DD-metalloendopeptidase family protein [bacterium]|nr:peptidoglycan DD-metalloendopeptidase family protein [bacterium]
MKLTPEAYAAWLASAPSRADIIRGATDKKLPYGRLSDPEKREGDPIAAGGYDEDRSDYTSDRFRSQNGRESRTVHLGLDLFAAQGVAVFCPLAGRVHSFRDNRGDGDYGPTLILEHALAGGERFHSLYGHLSRDSLNKMARGGRFETGDVLGTLGAREENGGWAPHLHVQLILDIGDWQGDFPGVFTRSERDRWRAICPDPAPFLGLQVSTQADLRSGNRHRPFDK